MGREMKHGLTRMLWTFRRKTFLSLKIFLRGCDEIHHETKHELKLRYMLSEESLGTFSSLKHRV